MKLYVQIGEYDSENMVSSSRSHLVMKQGSFLWSSDVTVEYDNDKVCLTGVEFKHSASNGLGA